MTNIVKHKRTNIENRKPTSEILSYGEIALNYNKNSEGIFIKNDNDEIVEFKTISHIENVINDKVNKLITNTELKFFCIEPVTVTINGEENVFEGNTLVDLFFKRGDEFSITTTSNNSIYTLNAWPGALGTYYEWLEGVNIFDGILFDMNNEGFYTKWSQGNQGLYHVQFAQYKNCIFWSDKTYVSDVSKRTNYTLYYTSELPLCYSTIRENTFKAFYFAYNVINDPNWSNPAYKESFAAATWATQVFSYYGAKTIGLFNVNSTSFNITLPKDCRGLMFSSPNIENIGVLDAVNCTNFGAKSGSWRDAFAYCYSLKNLYIKNLKVNLNISWSPVNQQSIDFIVSNATNTKAITIYLSPYTYNRLTDTIKTNASEKSITLSLLTGNYIDEDNRLNKIVITGDGTQFLSNDGTYKTVTISNNLSEFNNDAGFITTIPDEYVTNDKLTDSIELAIANLVDSAPETLDTLGELADALTTNSDVVSVLNDTISNKSDSGHTHDERYYTKSEVDAMLSGYVSIDIVKQMIKDAIDEIHGDNTTTPDTPTEPDTPEEPTTENIGEINENNEIIINEELLSSGTYTLKYIDSYDQVVDNFKPITDFTI